MLAHTIDDVFELAEAALSALGLAHTIDFENKGSDDECISIEAQNIKLTIYPAVIKQKTILPRSIVSAAWGVSEWKYDCGDRENPPDYYDKDLGTFFSMGKALNFVISIFTQSLLFHLQEKLFPAPPELVY